MLVVAVILLLSLLFHTAQGGGTLEIKFIEYLNSESKDYAGSCCDISFGCANDCDNYFVVCYRDYNPSNDSACTNGTRTTGNFDDNVKFPKSLKNNLDNPFSFGFDSWKNSFSLKITIRDDDLWPDKDDLVDVFRKGIPHASVPSNHPNPLTLNGKYGKTLSLQWRVWCNTHYYGNCSVHCEPEDTDKNGHYTCDLQTGQRLCLAGWTGAPQCKTPICKTGCSKQHGSCTRPGECDCDPGWSGSTCLICVPKSGCKHGVCLDGSDCICQPPWFGPLCDQDGSACYNNPCQNGGTCSVISSSFRCECPSGFAGSTCNVVICKTGCSKLHGSCTTPGECNCDPGWAGSTCSICVPKSGCKHGVCQSGNDCICQSPWLGPQCDQDGSGCNNHPCQNGGTCSVIPNGFVCACPSGWTGSTCSICVPKSGCKHGVCQSGNDCICQSPWLGPLCDQDGSGCNNHPCQNGGTCSVIPNGFNCACPSDFTGTTCDVDINLCRSNPCMHGATCQNLPNGFECNCRPGYTGQLCPAEINECLSNPCVFGSCSDLVNAFSCRCHSGFTGRRCDSDFDECASGLNNCGVNTLCNNTVGGYLCPCKPGYADAGDGRSCTRIQCKNLDSSLPASAARVTFSNDNRWVGTTAQIACLGGYKMQPGSLSSLRCLDDGEWDGEVKANIYSDIDECQVAQSPCRSGEVCHNTVGSYICETGEQTQTPETKAPTTEPTQTPETKAPTTISPCSDVDTAECNEGNTDAIGTPERIIDEKNNIGLYIGVAVGVLLLIVIIIVILLVLRRRSKRELITIVPRPPTQYDKTSSSMAMSMSACQAAVDKEHVAAKMKNEPFYDVIGDGSRPPKYEDMSGATFNARNLAYGSVLHANNANGAEHSLAETGVAAAEKDRPASQNHYLEPDVKVGGGVDV